MFQEFSGEKKRECYITFQMQIPFLLGYKTREKKPTHPYCSHFYDSSVGEVGGFFSFVVMATRQNKKICRLERKQKKKRHRRDLTLATTDE